MDNQRGKEAKGRFGVKFLKLRDGVKLTKSIERTIEAIDPYFENEHSYISSGLRSQEDQLRIIGGKAKRHWIDEKFPEWKKFDGNIPELEVDVDGSKHFWWQRVWSELLKIGDIVNPPIPAAVLFD